MANHLFIMDALHPNNTIQGSDVLFLVFFNVSHNYEVFCGSGYNIPHIFCDNHVFFFCKTTVSLKMHNGHSVSVQLSKHT